MRARPGTLSKPSMPDVSTTVRIRQLLRDDLNAVLEIQNSCKLTSAWTAREYEQLARDPRGMILVAELEGRTPARLPGFSVFYYLGEEAELWSIAVAPRFRRRGVARSLLGEASRRLCSAGVRKLFLEVRGSNTPALELYHSVGFTLLARRRDYYSNPREDALVLVRRLGCRAEE